MTRLALAALLALVAGPAAAERLQVDFGFFPEGTACQAYGTASPLTFRQGSELEYEVEGDVRGLFFRCALPDGRAFEIAPGLLYVEGASLTAVQVNADGGVIVMSDLGGSLTRGEAPGAMRWIN